MALTRVPSDQSRVRATPTPSPAVQPATATATRTEKMESTFVTYGKITQRKGRPNGSRARAIRKAEDRAAGSAVNADASSDRTFASGTARNGDAHVGHMTVSPTAGASTRVETRHT